MSGLLVRPTPFTSDVPGLSAGLDPQTERSPLKRSDAARVGVVVTGDNHLSAALPRLSPQRRAERRARLRQGFSAAVNYAIEHGARLFISAGDLFDSPTPSNQDRAFVAAALARLKRAGVVCVGISGNHDTPRMLTEQGGQAPQQTYAALDGLRYFAETDALRPILVSLGGLSVAMAGLTNNPVAPPGSDPLASVQIVDPERCLDRCDIAVLVLHAALEGLCQPHEGERVVTRASLDALPPIFRFVTSGHIHRYGTQRLDERTLVVCGATERMEFGGSAGGAGFAWVELSKQGVARAEHIRVAEQPRADLGIATSRLWPTQPDTSTPHESADVGVGETLAGLVDVLPPGMNIPARAAPDVTPGTHPGGAEHDEGPMQRLMNALAAVCAPETMVRLRLLGTLTREQYHQLVLRDVLVYGQQHAFSFDLDTSGLRLLDSRQFTRREAVGAGPISPVGEVRRLVSARVEQASGPEQVDDLRAAADLVLERLGVASLREGVQ